MRIAISIWAISLEELGVSSRATASLTIGATILVGLEHCARVVAATGRLQLRRALAVNVSRAPDPAACTSGGAEVHRDVESVDERYVQEVHVVGLVQGELGQSVGRASPALAVQEPVAVTSLALALAVGVKVAVGPAPYAGHGRAGVHSQGPCLARVKPAPTPGRRSGPDGVRALVDNVKSSCMDGSEEEGQQKGQG